MAVSWTLLDATASLRRRLSDGPTDKYRHQIDCDPSPDGRVQTFAVPESRIIEASLLIYLQGIVVTPTSVDAAKGTFTLEAPDQGWELKASYYFQWFTDAELADFLSQSTEMLGFDGVVDAGITLPFRAPVMTFACYYAYLKMAASAAPAWGTSAAGFSTDTSKEHPYWMNLARMMWDQGQKELESASTSPLTGKPAMAFVRYRLANYVPRS